MEAAEPRCRRGSCRGGSWRCSTRNGPGHHEPGEGAAGASAALGSSWLCVVTDTLLVVDRAEEATGPDAGGGDRRRVTRRQALAIGAGAAACLVGGAAAGRLSGRGPGTPLDRLLGRPPARTTNRQKRLAAQPDALFGVDTTEPVVALTFDDGPDSRYTSKVLEVLDAHRVHATFFAVGVNARQHPDLVRDLLAGGHTVGNHTHSHQILDEVPLDEAFEEILGGVADLRSVGVANPDLFRPPRGFTNPTIGAFATANGYKTVFWTLALEHYLTGRSVGAAVEAMLDDVRPGDVLLAHDGSGAIQRPEAKRSRRGPSVAALPGLLDGLEARGFRVVDLAQLEAAGPPRTASQLGD